MPALRRVALVGTGAAVPERTITNAELGRSVETDDAWIVSRTGIRERRIVAGRGPGAASKPTGRETTELSTLSARRALESGKVAAESVNLVVVATCTPDYAGFPATAPLVAADIGATKAFGFDVSLACTGFIAALMTAEKFIASGAADTALAIGADVMSAITDWKDRGTCVIFADGAGAGVLQACEPGARGEVLFTSLSMRAEADTLKVDPFTRTICMKGRETYKFAVTTFVEEILRAATAVGKTPADFAAIVPHQVNLRIMEAATERLGVSMDRVVSNIDRYGNTSAGSIPLALDEAARAGRFREGDLLCLVGFGGGLSWGSAVVRW